ncbi:MAG: tetratricopeptide repeat protein, partial [Thermodesulfobacteriota bacterium]|nr:tetratricopeptide repeat protein [Thermodesulfobacteriota bacterium]
MWVLVVCLFLSGPGLVAAQVLEREYTYRAGEVETRQSSRIIALELVERLILEDFGAGLKKRAEFRKAGPAKDETITLAPVIVRTEILSETWGGRTCRLRAGIEFDPNEAAESVIRLGQDRYLVGQLKKSRARADEYLKEINRLKIEPAKPAGREKERYNKAVRCLAAEAWFRQGLSFNQARRYLEAIRAYNKAAGLNPGHVWAYYNRGLTWADKGDLKRAIKG